MGVMVENWSKVSQKGQIEVTESKLDKEFAQLAIVGRVPLVVPEKPSAWPCIYVKKKKTKINIQEKKKTMNKSKITASNMKKYKIIRTWPETAC